MTAYRQVFWALGALVVAAMWPGAASAQVGQALRFGTLYQQTSTLACEDPASADAPCTIPFSTMDRGYLKVLKASCRIETSEGGSPSKEVTGAVLGRTTSNKANFLPGQFLAPIQSEFAGTGQSVLNFLVDTLWVVPQTFRPAIQIQRLNAAPVRATCTIVGEEIVPS